MKTEYDNKLIRCPKLGDEITFAYCLREAGNFPCTRIVHCWSSRVNIESLLNGILSPEQMKKLTSAAPKDKMSSLIELIEAAKAKK